MFRLELVHGLGVTNPQTLLTVALNNTKCVPIFYGFFLKWLSQQFILGSYKRMIKVIEKDFNICFISEDGGVTATMLAKIHREWEFKSVQSGERLGELCARIWLTELTFWKSFIHRYLY